MKARCFEMHSPSVSHPPSAHSPPAPATCRPPLRLIQHHPCPPLPLPPCLPMQATPASGTTQTAAKTPTRCSRSSPAVSLARRVAASPMAVPSSHTMARPSSPLGMCLPASPRASRVSVQGDGQGTGRGWVRCGLRMHRQHCTVVHTPSSAICTLTPYPPLPLLAECESSRCRCFMGDGVHVTLDSGATCQTYTQNPVLRPPSPFQAVQPLSLVQG